MTALLCGCAAEPASAERTTWDCTEQPYCAQIQTCKEAQYRLHVCGLKRLDANNDGEACELTCTGPSGWEVESQTFKGFDCQANCDGHIVGYEWAKAKRLQDGSYCPTRSQSFYEGCLAWARKQ